MSIKKFFRRIGALVLLGVFAVSASAGTYPSKPIKILVGFGAGGAADTVARLYGKELSEILHTPIVIENKPGANQLVAIRELKMSSADGYTLYLATGSALTQVPAVRSDLGYDPSKDFTPIGLIGTQAGIFVANPSLPVKSMDELVSYAKAHPGQISFESSGLGSGSHFATKYLEGVTGVKMTNIPYKSDVEAARELVSGTVQFGSISAPYAMEFIKAGKLRPLMVVAAHSQPYLPNVPGLTEVGVKGLEGMEPYIFYGLVGPAGLPSDVVSRLNSALNQITSNAAVANRMRQLFYIEPTTSTPDSFRAFVQKEQVKWKAVAKAANIKLTE